MIMVLPAAGISDDLHVLSLGSLRYADHRLHLVGLDAYAISCDPVVELLRRQHLGAFQSSSVSQLPCVVERPWRWKTGAG